MFEWDKTNLEKPIWRQAFSPDMGKTWEIQPVFDLYQR
jgi:hypothetical protein